MKKTILILALVLVQFGLWAQAPGDIAQAFGESPGFSNSVKVGSKN
jgi:hypothetical protein